MTDIEKNIYMTAKGWVGLTELPGNMGFHDKQFQEIMFAVGMNKGQAWCAWFIKACWLMGHVQEPKEIRRELFSIMNGGVVATYNSFVNSNFLVDKNPAPGAAVFWQTYRGGKANWTGHAGIVRPGATDTMFPTIEGNTNTDGGREGYIVAEKNRKFTWDTDNGLRLLGFVHPERKEHFNPNMI